MTAPFGVGRAAGVDVEGASGEPLARGRQAAADLRWSDAFEALSAVDRRSGLAAEDLELLATAAYLLGRGPECRHARLRAYQLYLQRGELGRAARCAARIGLEQLAAGEIAEAAGCLPVSVSACSAWAAHARALLEQEPDGPEHGYGLVPVAYERLATADPEGAADTAAQAAALGRRFGETDLLAMALMVEGRARVRSGRGAAAMALLDESVAMAASGALSPPVAGLVLTAGCDAGDEAFELGRCDEWTRALARWSMRQEGSVAFRCRSLATQAALERRHGRWNAAIELADQACEPPFADLDPTAAAAARYVQGEIRRLRGQLPAADAAYRQAGVSGVDPQPGMALLRLAEGDAPAARGSLERALGEVQAGLQRAKLLPAWVEILLEAGEHAAAAGAARELEQIALTSSAPALEATAQQAGAAVALADGDAATALVLARKARRVWGHFRLPYEEAQARALVAACCRRLGDGATATFELDAACESFARLGAEPALQRARPTGRARHGLTRREHEVLRLLATGMTNRSIAGRLQVTTRTVDTHVSRVLTKLGVSTRAAATAFAHRHGLM